MRPVYFAIIFSLLLPVSNDFNPDTLKDSAIEYWHIYTEACQKGYHRPNEATRYAFSLVNNFMCAYSSYTHPNPIVERTPQDMAEIRAWLESAYSVLMSYITPVVDRYKAMQKERRKP